MYETNKFRSGSSNYRRYYHMPMWALDPGASGATAVYPDSNTVGGWQVNASTEYLYSQSDVHNDWDGQSNLVIEIAFEKNTIGGSASDTVNIDVVCTYKGVGEAITKTQTIQKAITVDDSARYTQFKDEIEIDYDKVDNNVQTGDSMHFRININTADSDCDDIIINSLSFYYNTTHSGIEDGDI